MAKMERLNRVGSPIDICDGNLDSKPEVLEKKKKQIESIQRAKSRILDWITYFSYPIITISNDSMLARM